MTRAKTECEQCGQVDDHPKVHLGSFGGTVASKHHDCLSAGEEQAMRDSAQEEGSGPKVSAIIDAAKDGIHGAELVDLITSGDLPQAEGLAHKAALAEQARWAEEHAGEQASALRFGLEELADEYSLDDIRAALAQLEAEEAQR